MLYTCSNCSIRFHSKDVIVLTFTLISALIAAVTWPAALISAAGVIDNPWHVCTQRSEAAGKQLAEVLLAREQVHACCKNLENLDTEKNAVIILNFEQCGFTIEYCPKAADRMANSVDPDQTALGAVSSLI